MDSIFPVSALDQVSVGGGLFEVGFGGSIKTVADCYGWSQMLLILLQQELIRLMILPTDAAFISEL